MTVHIMDQSYLCTDPGEEVSSIEFIGYFFMGI